MAERVGPYELIARLGAGGMARVDQARLVGPYGVIRHVVIKRPLEHLAGDPAALERFRQEAGLVASLYHPAIVAVVDAGDDGVPYAVMEHVHGVTLRELVEPAGAVLTRPPPLDATLTIGIEIAEALAYAHAHDHLGIVHRDVTPANIMVGHDGAVKLIDFGVAKLSAVETVSGSLNGTITYTSPEQCKGQRIDGRADVFSLGVVLWELTTGRRLFHADDDVAALHKIVSGEIPRPSSVVPGYPPQLEAIVLGALAYEPERRLSAAALADALDAFAASVGIAIGADRVEASVAHRVAPLEPEPAAPAVAAPVRPPRRWPLPVAVAIASASLAVVVTVLLVRSPDPRAAAEPPAQDAAPRADVPAVAVPAPTRSPEPTPLATDPEPSPSTRRRARAAAPPPPRTTVDAGAPTAEPATRADVEWTPELFLPDEAPR